MMTSEETLRHYLKHQWPNGLTCPLCSNQQWFTPPEGPHVIEGMPMSMSTEEEQEGWAPPVGAWLCICSDCGFVVPLLEDFVSMARKELDSTEDTGI